MDPGRRLRVALAVAGLALWAGVCAAQTPEGARPGTRPQARPEMALPPQGESAAPIRRSHAALAEVAMTEAPAQPASLEPPAGTASALLPPGMRPVLRPERPAEGAAPSAAPSAAPGIALRPRARPQAPQDPGPLFAAAPDGAPVFGLEAPDAPAFSPLAVAVALRPPPRDPRRAAEAAARPQVAAPAPPAGRGALCGVAGLVGEVLAAIRGPGGCGVEEPVRLVSVGGVRLSSAAVMTCDTAAALLRWVRDSAQPRLGNRLARIETMGSYDCRPRNNQAGARMSEHGRGRAIDIGGFVLTSGDRITVLRHWGSGSWGNALRAMHGDACGTFGTVLGPNANRAHANHFHFDTARHGNGAYCR
jgi:hypothetical protein